MARKNALIKDFADYRRQQLVSGKFKFLRALARFADPHTLELSTGDKLTAANFVIATGSVVAPSPLPQLEDVGYLTSDTALSLTRLPKSLIVLGGGPVAVELAQFFARFRVRVTLIQRSAHILRALDDDAAAELEKVFRREGIDALHRHQTPRCPPRRRRQGSRLRAQRPNRARARGGDSLCAGPGPEHRLARPGRHRGPRRRPTASSPTRRCKPACRTSMLRAIAPACTRSCTSPSSKAKSPRTTLAHPDRMKPMDYRLLTEVIFTEPQIAVVGLTEKSARAANRPYLAASYPFNDHGKSLIMEAKDGFVKLLADPASGEIIGGCCVGPVGGELIHEIIAAMHKRMTVHELAAMPHYHPTLAEIWTYPAEELADKCGR